MNSYNKLSTYTLLLFAATLAYGNMLVNDFVYDDVSVIKNNRYLKSIANVKDIFIKNAYFARSGVAKYRRYGEGSYRPVVTLSYFVDYLLWSEYPLGSHLMNLFYHFIMVIVIYKLLFLISKQYYTAFLSALLFAVHPLGSEAINAISFREDILCGIFFSSALMCHVKYFDLPKKNQKYLFLAILSYLCACLSKENGIVFPFVAVCYNHLLYYPFDLESFKKGVNRFFNVYVLYALAAVIYIYIRFFLFNFRSPELEMDNTDTLLIKLIRSVNVISYYVYEVIFPDKLSPAHNNGFLETAKTLWFTLPVLISLIGLIFINVRKRPLLSFGLLWFFITILPVSGLVYLQHPVADRYMYLPMAGLVFFFSILVTTYLRPIRLACIGILVIVVLLAQRSIQQNTVWKSEFSLWDYTIKYAPKNYNTLANYAVVLADMGKYNDAIVYYKKALALDNRAQSHYNLANAYVALGLIEKAKEEYKISIKLDPNYSEAHNNLAKLLAEGGDHRGAVEELKLALQLNPYNAQAFNNLGACLNQLGQYEDAIKALSIAIQLQPNYISALFNIGTSYFKIGNYTAAEKCMRIVISYEPRNAYAQNYLDAILEAKMQKTPQESTKTEKFVSAPLPTRSAQSTPSPAKKAPVPMPVEKKVLQDVHPLPGYDAGKAIASGDKFMTSGQYIDALKLYRQAIRISPDDPAPHFKLASCYIKLGSFQLAQKELLKVRELAPDYPELNKKLSELERILIPGKKKP